MHFDWITWSLEFLGILILVAWIYLPAKEIKRIVVKMRAKRAQRLRETSG